MDTTRIIINQVDSSSVSLAEDTTVTGFTVVKAPKGPITPVYIPAAGTSKFKDIFGTATSDYPDLFEVSSYNNEYGVYVSAPYTTLTERLDKNRTIHEIQKEYDTEKEYMLLGLRKMDGVKISEFKLKFGNNPIYLFRNEGFVVVYILVAIIVCWQIKNHKINLILREV